MIHIQLIRHKVYLVYNIRFPKGLHWKTGQKIQIITKNLIKILGICLFVFWFNKTVYINISGISQLNF